MIPGIVAGQLSKNLVIEGLTSLGLDKSTNYYRFVERTSISYGPPELEKTPNIDNLRIWKLEQIDNELILSNSTNQYVLENNLVNQLNNLSLSFDQNGYPIVVWELNKKIYLRWYDPVLSSITITELGDGYAPYIALETFNDKLKSNRTIFIIHIDGNGNLVNRIQSDRYQIPYLIKSNVKDIIGFGPTDFNSLKIVFVNDKNTQNQYIIDSLGTERLGLYEIELLNASDINATLNSVTLSDTRNISNNLELSPNYTLENVSSNVTLVQYSTQDLALLELPANYTVENANVSILLKLKGYQRIVVDDYATDINVTSSITYFNIKNADIPASSDDYATDINITPLIQSFTVNINDPFQTANLFPNTWNNFDRSPNISLSSDKLTAYCVEGSTYPNNSMVKSVQPFSSGNLRTSVIEITEKGTQPCGVGISLDSADNDISNMADKWIYWSDGRLDANGSITTGWPTFGEGSIIQIVYDPNYGSIWIINDGVSLQGNPNSLSDPILIVPTTFIS